MLPRLARQHARESRQGPHPATFARVLVASRQLPRRHFEPLEDPNP